MQIITPEWLKWVNLFVFVLLLPIVALICLFMIMYVLIRAVMALVDQVIQRVRKG
jgi:phosphotransferase system  glucose/maltose/N-acetylglucosamine-specific IIC component